MPNGDQQFQYIKLPDGQYGKFRSDASDADIRAAIQKDYPNAFSAISKATAISPQPKMFSPEWFKQGAWRTAAGAADIAPAAGATIGGLIGSAEGPPGAIGGAGMGGMGGESAKQLIRRYLGFPDVPQTSGEAAKDIVKEGVIQAGTQGITELVPPLGGPLQKAAEGQYARALSPGTLQNKAITREITPELIRRGEFGSIESLEKKAGQEISRLSPELEAQYSHPVQGLPGEITTRENMVTNAGTKVLQDLDKLKQSYMPGGKVAEPTAVKAIGDVQNIIRQYGADISDTNLRRLRQIFEKGPAEKGVYTGLDPAIGYAVEAKQQAADSIREILNSHPDIGRLNKEISFWLDVQRVTGATNLRRVGQAGGLVKVLSPLAGAIGAGAGLPFGHATEAGLGAAVATQLAVFATQAIRSPFWRTASAVLKDRFAQAIASGEVGEAAALAARLTRAEVTGGGRSARPGTPPSENTSTQTPGQ